MVHLGTEPLSVWSYIYIAYAIEHEISTPWFSDRFNKFVNFLAWARQLFKKIKMLESDMWPSILQDTPPLTLANSFGFYGCQYIWLVLYKFYM